MAIRNGLGTTGDGVGTVTPLDHKLAQSALMVKTGAGTNTIRPGLFYDGVLNIVTGTANMSYNVAAFTAALSRGGTAGTVLLNNDGTVNVVTTAAPASNSRIDIVYVWQREFSLDGVNSTPVIGVVQGTAAASPVAPSLAAFPGALELARITVPAGVTATNTGTTIIQRASFTALEGAVLPVRNSGALPSSAKLGDQAYALDSGVAYEWSGSAWTIPQRGLRQVLTFTSSGSFSRAAYPWLRAIRVICQGGGGAGGGAAATTGTQYSAGQGGGPGAAAERFYTDIAALPSTVTITVGSGGVPAEGAAGAAGGITEFGASGTAWHVLAAGGSGGAVSPAVTGGWLFGGVAISGLGSVGTLVSRGYAPGGDVRIDPNNVLGTRSASGAGGHSRFGAGGNSQRDDAAGYVGASASDGQGGGGGGACNAVSQAARAGGAGAPGVVVVELFG